MFVYLITSIIGTANIMSSFLFLTQLLFIARFNKTIMLILKVFINNLVELLSMVGFLAIVCFIYAVFAFYFLEIEFYDASIASNQCVNLLSCVITAFNHPVRNGNGIGLIDIKTPYSDSTTRSIGKAFFDITYFFAVNQLLLNMVLAVIVESFNNSRAATDLKEIDIENKCFLCSVDRKEFTKLRMSYVKHIKSSHNIKHYIEYLINILLKPIPELEDDEIIIKENILDRNITIFPIGCFLDNNGKTVYINEDEN